MLELISLILAAWIVALFTVSYEKWPKWVPYIGYVSVTEEHPDFKDMVTQRIFVFEWLDRGVGFGMEKVSEK